MGSTSSLAEMDLAGRFWEFLGRYTTGPYNPTVVLIELLLIGVVVYTILRFLQGTRGARVVRAVLLILTVSFLVVQLVAHRFQFDRINFLYPYFLQAIFLVSLVAFQHELRQLLIRLGETKLLRGWAKQSARVVDPLVTAVGRFSNSRIGALIAIERTTQLGTVTDSGVALDAVVTAELLETIFWPGTPLHDLGVVIRQDRLVAAGCQFPLAESGDVERSLGSRHRAAMGISQESDAIVIVVSEETGAISVATYGTLRRGLTTEEFRRVMVAMLVTDKAKPRTKPTPDEPAPDKPKPDKPSADKPMPDKPAPDKPPPDKPIKDALDESTQAA